MEAFARTVVRYRRAVVAVFAALTLASAYGITFAQVNRDMSSYLPDSMPSRATLVALFDAFGETSELSIMAEGIAEDEAIQLADRIRKVTGISDVAYDGSDERYRKDGSSLFEVSLEGSTYSQKAASALESVRDELRDFGLETDGERQSAFLGGAVVQANTDNLSVTIALAMAFLLVILLAMSRSWVEPFVFLGTIGVAVVLGMGTNLLLPSISQLTFSIAAVLQLVLSMDYSIMLMNFYREQREAGEGPDEAMVRALKRGGSAICASSATTIAGLLCLTVMSFGIGADLGIVLAKGVGFSLLVVFTLLPAVILSCDTIILRTAKRTLRPQLRGLSHMQFALRTPLAIALVVLLGFGVVLKAGMGVSFYTQPSTADDKAIAQKFGDRTRIALLLPADSSEADAALAEIGKLSEVARLTSYATTVGAPLPPEQLAATLGLDEKATEALLGVYAAEKQTGPVEAVSLYDFLSWLAHDASSSPALAGQIDPASFRQVNSALRTVEAARDKLVSDDIQRAVIDIDDGAESDETRAAVSDIRSILQSRLGSSFGMTGDPIVADEAHAPFDRDLALVTALTIAAIFFIVALSFRSIAVPLILVSLIQGSINLTSGITDMLGHDTFYIAVVVVQAILMGATIDYAILYTENYRHARRESDVASSIASAHRASIPTFMTSGTILFVATLVLGLTSSDPTTAQVCLTLARGTAIAIASILLLLPGSLAALDRFTAAKGDALRA